MEAVRSNRPAHIPGDLDKLRPILPTNHNLFQGEVAKRFVRVMLGVGIGVRVEVEVTGPLFLLSLEQSCDPTNRVGWVPLCVERGTSEGIRHARGGATLMAKHPERYRD